MSASFRSHFRPSSQQDRAAPKDDYKQSARPSTKPPGPDSQPIKSVQHVSKLAKRTSRSTTSSERASHGIANATRIPTQVTSTHNDAAVTNKPLVTPSSDFISAANSKRLSIRQDSLPPPALRTPSLVSGSSASTFDSPRSNGLRRKASTIDRHTTHKNASGPAVGLDRATMHSRSERYDEVLDDSVLGISLPATAKSESRDSYRRVNTPSNAVQNPRFDDTYSTQDFTPPVPGFSQSATPSSRCTDSPFSHAPTPSSVSSYSSSLYVTTGSSTQQRSDSPSRSRRPISSKPTVREDQSKLGLPPVRESSTSSSNSTVKAPKVQPKPARTYPSRKEAPASTAGSFYKPTKSSAAKVTPTVQRVSAAPTKSTRANRQVPPELAHLNVEPQVKKGTEKSLPPTRPSRNGTPSLTNLKAPSSVVQSDLPRLYTTYHKRTPSQETPVTGTSPSLRSRFGLSPRSSSRQASPRIDSAISPPPSARDFARGTNTDPARSEGSRLVRKDSPVVGTTSGPGPSPSKSSRFGFLSRKSKGETTKTTEKPKREARKGPVAGTGHEGYGRFGFRGRSGSISSSFSFGRSPSADSSASSTAPLAASRKSSLTSKDGYELDDFLRDRLNPVVLRGSGSTLSNQAPDLVPHIPDSSSSPSLDSLVQPQLLPSAMISDRGMSPAKRLPPNRQISYESSGDDAQSNPPTLAARRSLTRSQSNSAEQLRVPPPINTNVPRNQAALDSYDAETSAWPQTDSTLPPAESHEGKEGLWLRPKKSEPAVKPARKWNFFERTHSSPRKGKGKVVEPALSKEALRDTSFPSMAHYAMLDPPEPVGLDELERIIQEPDSSAEDAIIADSRSQRAHPYELRHLGLLPSPTESGFSKNGDLCAESTPPRVVVQEGSSASPEMLRARTAIPVPTAQLVDVPRSPRIMHLADGNEDLGIEPAQGVSTPVMGQGPLLTPELQHLTESPRQPRLSPVGRIPQVVSRRDRDRRLPDNSFSRPFANTQPRPSVRPPGSLYNQIRDLASPVDPASQPVSSTSGRSDSGSTAYKSSINTDFPSVSTNRTSTDYYAGNEFMSFTPRKNSELTYSSSSGDASLLAPFPMQKSQEDEVWNEYNDLMDDVISPKTPVSAGSSLGAPFQYADMLHGNPSPSIPAPLNFGKPPSRQPTAALPMPPYMQQETIRPSLAQQVSRFLKPSLSPLLTPDTLSHFVDTYGSRNTDSIVLQDHQTVLQANRLSAPMNRSSISSRYSRASAHSRSASLPEVNARHSQISLPSRVRHDSQLLDIAEHEPDAKLFEANLRLGALMTSKWLSFGRVLFSPAHNAMHLSNEPRVLVVDGLGDDWSHYVALSYPNATVYNLGPSTEPGSDVSHASADWGSIPNHRHINHSALSAPFPFPKGFFAVVVFRFPIASTDQAYQACIFECKRVLRPGGHLEVAVLDLDLMNMGTRTRRAVRGLKTRMQLRDQNISLRNMSDVLVRLIGRRGFEDVQRCVVGVPAAGSIPRSQDVSSNSSISSGRRPSWDRDDKAASQELNFADLLQDTRSSRLDPDKTNDESITKMVAKVGRFWYSACYEKPLLQTDKSIWNEPGLLRECVKQGTSFRLLICCAQKPTQTRRRTVSV